MGLKKQKKKFYFEYFLPITDQAIVSTNERCQRFKLITQIIWCFV